MTGADPIFFSIEHGLAMRNTALERDQALAALKLIVEARAAADMFALLDAIDAAIALMPTLKPAPRNKPTLEKTI
jgi:hypothetical protein